MVCSISISLCFLLYWWDLFLQILLHISGDKPQGERWNIMIRRSHDLRTAYSIVLPALRPRPRACTFPIRRHSARDLDRRTPSNQTVGWDLHTQTQARSTLSGTAIPDASGYHTNTYGGADRLNNPQRCRESVGRPVDVRRPLNSPSYELRLRRAFGLRSFPRKRNLGPDARFYRFGISIVFLHAHPPHSVSPPEGGERQRSRLFYCGTCSK
jgi:hypothetical protein